MFIDNLRVDFYNVIKKSSCLLLVNFDVDAICTCKILQQLLKNDNVLYTLVPVQGVQDMVQAFQENHKQFGKVIMINCGGTLDIIELLQPPESVIFYILDNHRPYDLCNIYSENQIRILGKPTEDEDIPDYNDIFRDDSSDEEDETNGVSDDDDEDDAGSHRLKRRRLNEEDLNRKRERRIWMENRATILFNYSQYSYYSKPENDHVVLLQSSLLIYELAWDLAKDNLDMVWYAIVGVTEQTVLGKLESRATLTEEAVLQAHVSRLTRRQNAEATQQTTVKVTFGKDLRLPLYRHWTVEASLRNSSLIALPLRLWSMRGEQRLKGVLAEMGLPLAQSRQLFTTMDLALRQEFQQMMEKMAEKYNFDGIIGTSFTLQYGYRFKYCAIDVVYAMLALMESPVREKLPQRCFLDALDCLSRAKKNILENGIEKAKIMLRNIFKTAQAVLGTKRIMNAGSFLYVIVSDGTVDSKLFSHPHSLTMLAKFALSAYVDSSKRSRAREWPMLASATYNVEESTCLVVGIPPVCEDQPKSLFGKAFEQAAKNANCCIDADYFDASIIRLKIAERQNFFDALAALLTK